jgi:hypothetical protein
MFGVSILILLQIRATKGMNWRPFIKNTFHGPSVLGRKEQDSEPNQSSKNNNAVQLRELRSLYPLTEPSDSATISETRYLEVIILSENLLVAANSL